MRKVIFQIADFLMIVCFVIAALSTYLLGEKIATQVFGLEIVSSFNTVRILKIFTIALFFSFIFFYIGNKKEKIILLLMLFPSSGFFAGLLSESLSFHNDGIKITITAIIFAVFYIIYWIIKHKKLLV